MAWWFAIGHSHTEPILSSHVRGKNTSHGKIMAPFIKQLAPLSRELAIAFATIDYSLWSRCMKCQMDKPWKSEKNAENIKSCRLNSFHGRAVPSNVDTHAHDDGHDHKDGLVIATVFGDFKKGEFVGQVPLSVGKYYIH